MCGRSRLVSAKCPRWLVPIWSSKPSAVFPNGTIMIPALLMRMSTGPVHARAKARIDARSVSSSWRTSVRPPALRATSSPLATLRTARTTRAPTRASSWVVGTPKPLDAPVTITVLPVMSGRSPVLHRFDFMSPLCAQSRNEPFVRRNHARLCGPAVDRPDQLPVALDTAIVELGEPVSQVRAVGGGVLPAGCRAESTHELGDDDGALGRARIDAPPDRVAPSVHDRLARAPVGRFDPLGAGCRPLTPAFDHHVPNPLPEYRVSDATGELDPGVDLRVRRLRRQHRERRSHALGKRVG